MMTNSVMSSAQPTSVWRHIYVLAIVVLLLLGLAYGSTFAINIILDNQLEDRRQELRTIDQTIQQIGSEKTFFSYKFADNLVKSSNTKRSDQITALITVLKQIQTNNSIGPNAIKLSDFSISPTKLTLKGQVSNLILLYYSSEVNNYINLIDRFAELPFITNITIKKYDKVDDFYEFALDADIDPNVIIQSKQQSASTN